MSIASQFIEAFNQALERSDATSLSDPFCDFYDSIWTLNKNSKDYEKEYFKLLQKEGLIDNPDPSQLEKTFLLFIRKLLDKDDRVAQSFLNDSPDNLKGIYNGSNSAYLFAMMSGMLDLANALEGTSSPEVREKIFSIAITTGNIDLAMAQLSFEDVKDYAKKHPDILLNLALLAVRNEHLEAVKVFFEITGNDSINDAENILSEALTYSRGPVVNFLLNNDKIREKLSDISVLLKMISGKPPEMVASLLSKDSMAAVVASNAGLIFEAIFAEGNDKTLALVLQIPTLKEYFVAQNQKILAQIQEKKNGEKLLAVLLQALNLGAADKNSKPIEDICRDLVALLKDRWTINTFLSSLDKMRFLNLFGVNESALADKIISMIYFTPIYNLKNQTDPVSLSVIHDAIKDYLGDIRDLYHGEKELTSSQLAEDILKMGENISSGEELEKAIASVKNLKLTPILTEKITKLFFYQAIENAKDEQSIIQIIEKYPGDVIEICSTMGDASHLVDLFTEMFNNLRVLNKCFVNHAAILNEWQVRYGLHPLIADKFITIAAKKWLCALPYSERWVEWIDVYSGSISHFIKNDNYKANASLANFLRNLLNDEAILAKAYSKPEEILSLLQKEGVEDEELKQTFLRVIQEKNLSNLLTKVTSYSAFEREVEGYPRSAMHDIDEKRIYQTNKDEVLKGLKSLFANPQAQFDAYYRPEVFSANLSGVVPYVLSSHCLRVAKLEYEAAQKKAIANYPSPSLNPDEPLRFAIANNMFAEAQALYEKGARVSHETIKILIENARKENNPNKVAFLLKLFELKQGSLFANAEEFRIAAIHANKHFLAQPYQNGLNEGRWGNQGAIVLLGDNRVIEVPAEYLHGISIAKELARTKKQGELVTLEEIVAEAEKRGIPLKKEMVGQVDVAALEASYSQRVLKVKYRPNHDLQHSLRAAAYIYPIYQLFNANEKRDDRNTSLSRNEIESLQLMMLFSVLGREDETGFADSKNGGAHLYQSYRAVDAFEFLSYCLKNWDRHYKNVFADKDALYQAALVVELMGYPAMPNIEEIQPRPLMSILMRGDSPENMRFLKEWIQKYPNNNLLRAYSEEQLRALFPKKPINYQNKQLDTLLFYMNSAHGADLLRCYEPGDPTKIDDPGTFFGNLIYFYLYNFRSLSYQGKLKEASPAEQLMDYFKFTRNMLDAFGEKKTTDCESNDSVLKETLAAAKMLEKVLGEYKGKRFTEVKDLKFERKINVKVVKNVDNTKVEINIEVETLEALLTALGLDKVSKENNLTASSIISEQSIRALVPRFIAHSFLKTGAWKYTPAALAHCHYRINKQQSPVKVPLSAENIQTRDLEKEVDTSLAVIEELPRPAFCKKTTFTPDEALNAEMQRVIHQACEDGVAIFKDKKEEMIIEFSSSESATKCFEALLRLGKIAKIPAVDKSATAPYVARAKITELEYAFIKPYLKFRKATPPKQHNVESNMVEPTGNIAALSLIDNYNAVICNHNSRPLAGGNQTGVEWYFNQLEHPSTERPTRLSTLTEAQRTEVHSMTPAQSGERYSVNRELREPLPVEQQEPRERPPARSEYWKESNMPVVRHVSRVRGQPKNTIFVKKSPHTLMIPKGQTLFHPPQGSDLDLRYFPIGFVSDVNAVHTVGERYIWLWNSGSNRKLWLDLAIDERSLPAREGTTLNGLKTSLQTLDVSERWNELLVGGSKPAIKALACSGAQGFDNKTTLSYRLNLVTQAIFLREKYGVNVPLLIVEGNKAPYLYTEKILLADILSAIHGLQTDSYPYMRKENSPNGASRLTCEEQMILIQFLETFTGHRFEGSFTFYGSEKEYLEKSHVEPYGEYTKKINIENTKNLKAYLAKCGLEANPHLSNLVKEKVDNLKLIGFESREREYLNRVLSTSPSSEKTFIDLLIRNVALGHTELVKELIKIPEATALLTKPLLPNGGGLLEAAVNNGELEMVKFLLSKNCDPHAVNSENVSPIDIVAARMKDKNNPHVESYQLILEELRQYKPATHPEARHGLIFSGIAPVLPPVKTAEQEIKPQEKDEAHLTKH